MTPRIFLVLTKNGFASRVSTSLEELGHDVTVVTDSRQAFRLFLRHPSAFDVAVVDQRMPHVFGVPLVDGILRVRPDIPVIAYSDSAPSYPGAARPAVQSVVSTEDQPEVLVSMIRRISSLSPRKR